MQDDQFPATARYLYEGNHNYPGPLMAEKVEFHDPFVVVKGRDKVERMFRRLNQLFPATRVVVCESIGEAGDRYALCVHYRRHARCRPTVFRSVLEVVWDNGRIARLQEHWVSPLNRRGDDAGAMSSLLRRTVGRMVA